MRIAIVVLLAVVCSAALATPVKYFTITQIPLGPQGVEGLATDINDNGDIVGCISTSDATKYSLPKMWRYNASPYLPEALPLLSGFGLPSQYRLWVTNGRIVVGTVSVKEVPFYIKNGIVTRLSGTNVRIYGINDHGDVAGKYWITGIGYCPTVWDANSLYMPITLSNVALRGSTAYGLSDGGFQHKHTITGANNSTGFVWTNGVALRTLADCKMMVVSPNGLHMTGVKNDQTLYWTGQGEATLIIGPNGYSKSTGVDINSSGELVGNSTNSKLLSPVCKTPFFWSVESGLVVLPALVVGKDAVVYAINASGYAVGIARNAVGKYQPVKWTPVR